VVWLTWGVLAVSVAVILIIAGLLLAAMMRGRPGTADSRALEPDSSGASWLWIGVSLSGAALLFTVIWTVEVLADIQAPPQTPRVTIEITGRQWWWQVRYLSGAQAFETANEIHIPVGEPVRIRLIGGDVIHSFWVPQLAGKMDAIPGLTNETWIEAAAPGDWLGQCTEYCGVEHARMLLRVIAQAPADFAAWQAHQLEAPLAASGEAAGGQEVFARNCGGCHAVRGTGAQGTFGPDLSHLMQRGTLASASLPNDPATLASRNWRAKSFPDHPYGQPADGTLETLARIERGDLVKSAKRGIARDQLLIAVVGAIEEKEAAALVDKAFADLPAKGDLKPIPGAAFAGLGAIDRIDLDVPQSTIRFGRPALKRDDPDFIPSVVAAHVLGGSGSMTSRLFREVREKRGLAYTVFGTFYALEQGAYFYGGTTTKNERARESFDVASAEIRDVALNGLNAEELEKGKTYLIGSYPLRFDTSAKIASQLVHIQLERRAPEWLVERNREIAGVTMASVKRAAHRAFGDGSLHTTVVGRPEGF